MQLGWECWDITYSGNGVSSDICIEGIKGTVTYSTHTLMCMQYFNDNSINILLFKGKNAAQQTRSRDISLSQGELVNFLKSKILPPVSKSFPSLVPLLSSWMLCKIQQIAIILGRFLISLCSTTELRWRSNARSGYLFLICCTVGVVPVLGKSPKESGGPGQGGCTRAAKGILLYAFARYCLEQLPNNSWFSVLWEFIY